MKLYVRFLNEYIFCKKNILNIVKIIIIMLFTTIFSFANAVISKLFVNAMICSNNIDTINFIGLTAIVVVFIGALISIYQNYFMNRYIQKICLGMRMKLYDKIMYAKWNVLDSYEVGELQFRMFSDISIVTENASLFPMNIVASLLFIIIINVFSLFVNLEMLVMIDILLLFNGVLYYLLQKRMEKFTKELQEKSEMLYAHIFEKMSNIKLIQIYSAYLKEKNNSFKFFRKYYKAITEKKFFENNATLTSMCLISFLNIGILWIGGIAVIKEQMTLGDITAFLSIISIVISVSKQIANGILHYPMYIVSLKRVYEILDEESINNKIFNKEELDIQDIIFENVSFGYNDNNLINQLDMVIYKNKLNIIIGDSGIGKTTILKILIKAIDDYQGKIVLGKKELKDIPEKKIRKYIIYVGSIYTPLMQDTIYNNITYSCRNAEFEDVIKVTKLVNIHDRIQKLPNGYFTNIEHGGVNLSDGEKQRIILARALILQPSVLLLDEITANLDFETENIIMRNLKELSSSCTIVLVSHRKETQEYADNIVDLNKFKFKVEEGL